MNASEVKQELCSLCTEVNEKVFGFTYAADCFCGDKVCDHSGYRFDKEVLEFIKDAVKEKINAQSNIQE